ncbi:MULTISPECIES: hypothetical protein [Kordiimonas]|jgi:hypothetical protein|uniref:hypothetical protein n=1 Tax=Kordiimonas TaxID=288021 RepID=UPI00257D5460|nr:hypothetical protein [Kordiimonas sp. UBA4487]
MAPDLTHTLVNAFIAVLFILGGIYATKLSFSLFLSGVGEKLQKSRFKVFGADLSAGSIGSLYIALAMVAFISGYSSRPTLDWKSDHIIQAMVREQSELATSDGNDNSETLKAFAQFGWQFDHNTPIKLVVSEGEANFRTAGFTDADSLASKLENAQNSEGEFGFLVPLTFNPKKDKTVQMVEGSKNLLAYAGYKERLMALCEKLSNSEPECSEFAAER